MESVSWLQIVTYLFLALVIIAFVMQLVRYVKMPTHLRWELYPLAGEKKRQGGGSYLEESEWWTKPPEGKSLLGEIKFIGEEILLFKEYYRHNRDYWYLVYPFHIGVFLFVAFLALLLVGALTMVAGMVVSTESANIWGRIVYYLTLVTGGAGLTLGALGCIGLLIRRAIDKNLKPYTRRIDYLNLLFVLVVFVSGFFSWIIADRIFDSGREYVKSLITFSPAGSLEPLMAVHIVLLLLIAAYIPFTNMMHFFAKSFAYHMVRWDDVPNLRGSKLEKGMGPLLSQPLSWSAPHIQPIKRWSDTAQEIVLPETTEEHTPRIRKGVSS
ncbi:respiratory nitrate reductase subunit gamma [Chloroflexota bacterium]